MRKISLRKLGKIESSLDSLRKPIDSRNSNLVVQIFSNVDDAMSKAESIFNELADDLAFNLELQKVRYQIRLLISDANSRSGVSAYLTKKEGYKALSREVKAFLDLDTYDSVIGAEKSLQDYVLGNLESLKSREGRTSFQVPVVSKKDAKRMADELQKLKSEIEEFEDAIQALNASTMVEITEDIESFLIKVGLLK